MNDKYIYHSFEENMEDYYVYVYKDPDTLKPFYIGKGKNKRCFNHLNWKSTFKRVKDKIASIKLKGKEPLIEIIKSNLIEEDAYNEEEKLILEYGRKGIEKNGILMNICLGSRPPCYKNSSIIKNLYADFNEIELTNQLVNEVKLFLINCDSRKRFNNLLKTDVGRRFILATKNFPEQYDIPQRLFHIINNIQFEPCCKNCGNKVSFKIDTISFKKSKDGILDFYGYAEFCSTVCRNKGYIGTRPPPTEEHKEKLRKSSTLAHLNGKMNNLFKTNNPMKNEEIKLKWKSSRNKKY